MRISFYSELSNFKLLWERKCRKWLLEIVKLEGKGIKSLDYNFVGKEKILEINSKFLNHDYFTDVIAFDSSYLNLLEGEIFICIPIIEENVMENEGIDFNIELARVIVHGLLHLIGYRDKEKHEIEVMRGKENEYLLLLSKS